VVGVHANVLLVEYACFICQPTPGVSTQNWYSREVPPVAVHVQVIGVFAG
jgi:hypothetical protein